MTDEDRERDDRAPGAGAPDLPDGYAEQFLRRYRDEELFREMVHDYLGVSALDRAGLYVSRLVSDDWFEQRARELVADYSRRVAEGLTAARELRRERRRLALAKQELEQAARTAELATRERAEAEAAARTLLQEQASARAEVRERRRKEAVEELQAVQAARAAVRERTDVRRLVQARLRRHVQSSGLVVEDEEGRARFDEQRLIRRLEDLFLEEILEDVEQETRGGFLADLQDNYDGLIAYNAEMEDLAELPAVDWIHTIIHARTRGHRIPRYPYLITEKYQAPAQVGIDTAISVDTSQSMSQNCRIDAAKKTALALRALMRRLNPENTTRMSHFNSTLAEVTSEELMRDVKPAGTTATDQALAWLLEVLADRGPALAYLITDGAPNWLDRAAKQAEAFLDHPQVMLRIFLVDGDRFTVNNVRRIGLAAGERTRVVQVKSEELAAGMIRDVASAVGEMYDIADF